MIHKLIKILFLKQQNTNVTLQKETRWLQFARRGGKWGQNHGGVSYDKQTIAKG